MNAVLEQYELGKPITEGTLGNLTAVQDAALRDLWRRLLDHFPNSATGDNSQSASIANDEVDSTAALSSALSPGVTPTPPLSANPMDHSKRSSRLRQSSASPATTPTSDKQRSSSSSSWFGFGGSAKPEPVSYRQLVGDVAPEGSRPPERYSSAVMTRAAPTVRDAFWDTVLCDHPDVLLLRFLRARKWKPEDALNMLLACLRWRLTEDIDWLIWTGESRLNLALMRSGVGAMYRTDRIGQPVLHIPVRLNDPKAQPLEQIVEYTIYLMEVARCVLHPPVEKVCLLVDTTDMSLSNMDWNFFRTFLHYLEHYYPECLGLVLIYNASWVFNSMWKLIRPLLDPVVASKVQFAASQKDLQRFIAPENLPIELGGSDRFTYTYAMPAEKENAAMFDSSAYDAAADKRYVACDDFEAATRAWANTTVTPAEFQPHARTLVADSVIAASKAMDKYRRARTQYHRTGVIADNLAVNWGSS
ncbi:phosphatidylinositol transfer protein csr1 [Coemansia furcata]|uniref:Phosphatidylinositol transfer protein csr1 n=1 Tax=Coemansia furcata TaxID=417177 RepID=A0ACC1LHS1_9FUNG|nr:phosphatidylinositol transfer protein csr1 [Coemansia furcata]